MVKPENPSAFPYRIDNGITSISENGITLRDYFASKAMIKPVDYRPRNFIEWLKYIFGYSYKSCTRSHEENAILSYQLADAMLKQREL